MAIPQQLLPWQAYKQDCIEALGLRLYLALHELEERRRFTPSRQPHYGVRECQKLLGSTVRVSAVEKALDSLCTCGLVDWRPSALAFPTQPAALPGLDLRGYKAMRAHVHPKRVWVPMYRRMLRYLVHEGPAGLIATVFYVSQHCYWNRAQRVCAGAISPASLSACYGFSEKTASRHLATLQALGWFTVEPRPRFYVRKYGRWCILNPQWEAPKHPPSQARPVRLRRPVQLLLPLRGDTARPEAGPPLAPPLAASLASQAGGSSPRPEARAPVSVDATPARCAQVAPEEGCEKVSSCEDTSCEILSSSTPVSPSIDANFPCSHAAIPFQEIREHQIPAPQADTTPPTVPPTPAALTSSSAAFGVYHTAEQKPEAPKRPPDMAALEAAYTALPAEQQAALRAEAEAVLIQTGTKHDCLVWPAILSEIGRLLETQAVGDTVGPPAPTRATLPPRTSNASAPQVEATPARAQTCPVTRPPRAPAAGVHPGADRTPQRKPLAPTLRHILPEDLQDIVRLLVLFDQAIEQGLIGRTAPERLTFVAIAVHALRVGVDNPCGLFRTLLHDAQLRIVLSDADDEAARVLLNTHEYGIDPARRGPPPPAASEPPTLSEDARFVDLARRVLGQDGWHGDPFLAVKMQNPAWTRARWDQAVCELEQHQRARKANRLTSLEDLGLVAAWWASRGPGQEASCPECGAEGPACVCGDVEEVGDG